MKLAFTKMHGLGNDFMVVDAVSKDISLRPETIRHLGDRHTGIGFDQLLIVAPPTESDVDFTYEIYNSDGSPAEHCGNGARCVAYYVQQHDLASKSELTWQTCNGRFGTTVRPDGVEVDMGVPSTAPDVVPHTGGSNHPTHAFELNVEGTCVRIQPVSVGNPHGVIFVESVQTADVATLGPILTSHPAFPEGANIGFCEIVDENFVRLRVHERGVGETRACGTGACAAVVAGVLQERLGHRVKVSLPGGKVRIQWSGPGSTIKMTGPATLVYEGVVEI